MYYADDGVGGGKLDSLLTWWILQKLKGPVFGYFPNPPKSWLLIKPEHAERAAILFTDANITQDGREFLGSIIGNPEATKSFVEAKVEEWVQDIDTLSRIALIELQLA